MAKQTDTVTVSQADWDAKYAATTEALKDLGGVDAKAQDDLPDGTTAKQYTATEKTKLGTVDENAKDDQTGAEIQTAIEGLADADRNIIVSDPQTGEHKVYGVHRNAAGDLEYDYEDVAV